MQQKVSMVDPQLPTLWHRHASNQISNRGN